MLRRNSIPTSSSFARRSWRVIKKTIILLFLLQLFYIVILKWVYPPITVTQFISWVSGHGLKRDYVGHQKISANARLAVIASEDQLYADHNGFDWKSIRRAIKYNERKPGRIRGASTISQQVAKNVFLWQGRSWLRKAFEVYFTFMIEVLWGKKRILDVYLNVIETGDGIFGFEMASQIYFGKNADSLTRLEAAMIAACLPSPKRIKVNPPSRFTQARSRSIMRQMSFIEPDPDVGKLIQ